MRIPSTYRGVQIKYKNYINQVNPKLKKRNGLHTDNQSNKVLKNK